MRELAYVRTGQRGCWILLFVIVFMACGAVSLAAETDQAVLRSRRQRLSALAKQGLVIVHSVPRNQLHLTEYFIDHSDNHDFIYLTGLEMEKAALILLPQSEKYPEILFVSDMDIERARDVTGIATILSIDKLSDILSEALTDYSLKRYTERKRKPVSTEMARVLNLAPRKVFYFNYPRFLNLAEEGPPQLQLADRLRLFSPVVEIRDLTPLLTHLRAHHDAAELEVIRRAVMIGSDALLAAMKASRPEAYDYQVNARAEFTAKSAGADRMAYPSLIYIAPFARQIQPLSEQTLGRSSEPQSATHRMENGDLVMLDLGIEYQHYATDLSRTIPVSGKFTPEQRGLYEAVLQAHHAALAAIRPGATIREIHEAAVNVLKRYDLDQYFTFGTSHFIGMEAHDPGNYEEPLEPGMILVIEPGFIQSSKNIIIHVEDMILVTADGHENLSARIPIEIEEIEKFLAER